MHTLDFLSYQVEVFWIVTPYTVVARDQRFFTLKMEAAWTTECRYLTTTLHGVTT